MTQNSICRLPDVVARTGLSRSTIYALVGKQEFPKQIRLSRRTVGWLETDIEEWISDRVNESITQRLD